VDVLPKVLKGKGVEIHIDAPILTDSAAIEEACRDALKATAEAIVSDVVYFKWGDTFADSPGKNTFRDYGSADAYYSSGKIPYWRGGLVGSFQATESDSFDSQNMSFTASYAQKIEQGGGSGEVEAAWWDEKTDGRVNRGIIYSTQSHPFVEQVAMKLDANLENFGYLDVFATTFCSHFTRYL